jgi:hypothetical protein
MKITKEEIENIVTEIIKKSGDQYCVHSEKSDKNLGCSSSKAGAKKRLGQIEYFKNLNKEQLSEIVKEALNEVTPPGYEKNVKGIKKSIKRGDTPKTYTDKETGETKETSPWAIAWSQKNKGMKEENNMKNVIKVGDKVTVKDRLASPFLHKYIGQSGIVSYIGQHPKFKQATGVVVDLDSGVSKLFLLSDL